MLIRFPGLKNDLFLDLRLRPQILWNAEPLLTIEGEKIRLRQKQPLKLALLLLVGVQRSNLPRDLIPFRLGVKEQRALESPGENEACMHFIGVHAVAEPQRKADSFFLVQSMKVLACKHDASTANPPLSEDLIP